MTHSGIISVIMPVFNAEPFLREAVVSAVSQEEVKEVLLIEDGSSDGSLEIARQLQAEYPKARLLQHPGGENKGPGFSRNLGLKSCSGKYVAFLDADDVYLPARFRFDLPLLEDDDSLDGAYSVIGVIYEDNDSKNRHLERMRANKRNLRSNRLPVDVTGMERAVPIDKLFLHLLKTDEGWIHLNGLLLRASALDGLAWFNDAFLGQDSEFITRLSHYRRLACSGDFSPVASRRVHQDNRILQKSAGRNRVGTGFESWLKLADESRDARAALYCLLRAHDGQSKPVKLWKLIRWFSKRPYFLWG